MSDFAAVGITKGPSAFARGASFLPLIMTVALFALPAAGAFAASFDCHRATREAEKTICADTELSKLDEQLATAYENEQPRDSHPAAVKSVQRQWIRLRNDCGQGTECLRRLYEERLADLNAGDTAIFKFQGFPSPDSRDPRGRNIAYSPPIGESLWSFVAAKLPHHDPHDPERAQFARIGADSFLVVSAGFYVAHPSLGKLEHLDKLPNDTNEADVNEFRSLPDNGQWLLLRVDHLSLGILTTSFWTIFIHPSRGAEPVVTTASLGTFTADENGECPGDGEPAQLPADQHVARHVEHTEFSDFDHHGSTDGVVIYLAEQNCVTRATVHKALTFVNTGAELKLTDDAR